MTEIKDLKDIRQAEETPKKKGLKRWHYLLIGFLLVLLITGIGLTILVNKIYAQAAETPLPLAPGLAMEVVDEPGSKTELYEEEIRNQKQNARKEKVASEGLDRIRMSWDKIYGDRQIEEETPVVEDAPKPQTRRRRTTIRKQSPSVKRDTVFVQKTPRFNLKKEDDGPILQGATQAIVSMGDFVNAVISGDQKVASGQPVKLRILQPFQTANYLIPKNSSLVGLCRLSSGRVHIDINQVLIGGQIIPINLASYDQDLVKGIAYDDPRMERQLKREMARETGNGVDNALRNVPYVGGLLQPIVKGIEQKVNGRTIAVKLTNNYRILLKEE